MEDAGFITSKDDDSYNECNELYTNINLTEKGKRSLQNETEQNFEIKLFDIVFDEITGIIVYEELKAAEVNYTLRKENFNEFGKIISNNSDKNEQNNLINHRIGFVKYDDGWRIGK